MREILLTGIGSDDTGIGVPHVLGNGGHQMHFPDQRRSGLIYLIESVCLINKINFTIDKLNIMRQYLLGTSIYGNLQNNLPRMQSAIEDHAPGLSHVQSGDGRPD